MADDTTNELVSLSATEVAASLQKGKVSPFELADAAAARIREVEPSLRKQPVMPTMVRC